MSSKSKSRLFKALRTTVNRLRDFAYRLPSHDSGGKSPYGSSSRSRVGLALGGGFARGLAHLGVLRVLHENQIPIDALAGTSVGSLVAAGLASGCTLEEMVEHAREVRWKDFARWTLPRLGFARNDRMEAMLRRFLRCTRFEELRIPLAVVATDVSTGDPVVFRQGDLMLPLRASCSFPGLFVPVEYAGRVLVDGAIVGSVPVGALEDFRVDVRVGVYLKSGSPRHKPENIFQVVGQAFQIAERSSHAAWREACDVVIEPEVGDFKWDAFERADELIDAGTRAARRVLPELLSLLNPREAEGTNRLAPVRELP